MPKYRITVQLSGNVEADSREAAIAEANAIIAEMMAEEDAVYVQGVGQLLSCHEIVEE